MALNLVTGYKGRDHITAEQWADFNRGIFGEAAILPVGNKMAVSIQTANQITVKDGVAVFDGREVYIGYGESENITIQSGTQGMKRKDIVVVKYTRDEETGVEEVAFEVINGLPSASSATDPVYQNTDIRTGVFTSQKPFCRVRLNGTAIEGIDMLVLEKSFKDIAFSGSYNDLSNKPQLKTVATSGNYNDLSNKPTSLPANGGNASTVGGKNTETLQNYNNLTNKPSLGSAASKNVANNFTTNVDGYIADARTVKQLNDELSALKAYSEGNGSPNTNVLNGGASCKWHKCGKICHVEMSFSTKSTLTEYALLFSGLPKAAYNQNFFFPAADSNGICKNGNLEIGVTGEIHENWYHKPTPGVNVKTGFTYITQ